MSRKGRNYHYRPKEDSWVVNYKGKYYGIYKTEDEAKEVAKRARDGLAYTPKTSQELRAERLKGNPNYYSEMGSRGGQRKVPKGFALNRELASEAGRKGGTISRRK